MKSAEESRPPSVRLCCFRMMAIQSVSYCSNGMSIAKDLHFAAKLVSVAFVFFGRALPTFNLGFWKSFAFSFFFFDEAPILHLSDD